MTPKECRQRSIAAEQAGDERKALYWSRRETGAEPLPRRVLVPHGRYITASQSVTSRKQMERIVRNLLTPMGRAYLAPPITMTVVHS